MSISKLQKMQRFVPSLFRASTNPNIRGLLYAWAGEDDAIVQAIQDAKEQIFITTSQLLYLDSLGSNVGVFRPPTINISDELYRKLIPAMSYHPKQVITTINTVLDIFFGENNPDVKTAEIRPNEIEIQIPRSIPALRRDLRGAQHFHAYNGTITAVDNTAKTMTIDLDLDGAKILDVGELVDGYLGVSTNFDVILGNTSGSNGVTLQFAASSDLSVYSVSDHFNIVLPNYPGSFFSDPRQAYSVTKQRGILGQAISAGAIAPTIVMTDSSNIPDSSGLVVFNYGRGNKEDMVKYVGRPNNTTLLLDPGHVFQKDHEIGEIVNVIVTPYEKPSKDGSDYSIYIVGVTAARMLAQQMIESLIAAGIVINWTVVGPKISC